MLTLTLPIWLAWAFLHYLVLIDIAVRILKLLSDWKFRGNNEVE